MPETQNIRNDNAHEQGIRFLSLLNLMTLVCREQTEATLQQEEAIDQALI